MKKQHIKQLFVGAAMLATVSSAQATTVDLSVLPEGYSTFGNLHTPGSFTDVINFSLSSLSDADFGAGALNFSIGKVLYLNISSLTLTLFNSFNTELGSGLNFSIDNLAAGDYHLQVAGTADGLTGGLYAGGIHVSAETEEIPPVPEANTSALMLAGLALMGFIARRRRDN